LGSVRLLPMVMAFMCAGTLPFRAVGSEASAPPADDAVTIVNTFVSALSNADLEGLVSTFAEDATVFMPSSELSRVGRLSGKAAIRDGFRPFLDGLRQSGKGPPYLVLTPRDLSVQNLGATAIVTFHLKPLPKEPIEHPVSFSRRTFVVHRTDAGWLIVHLHASNVVIEASGSSEARQR